MRGESDARRRKLLEELKELFGPAFGPAVEAQGRSFAERVCEHEELVTEVLARFERGKEDGQFPTLSELLGEASKEEQEGFFREGWAREVLPPPAPPRKPWDDAPWCGNLDAYREDLYFGIAFGLPDFRAFAQEWIEELARVGYYGMEESLGLPLKQQADDFFSPPRPLPLYGDAYPVRLGDTRQTVWISLDGPRSPEWGYREIVVSEEPLRTDKAILAAVTAMEGRPLEVRRLRKVLPVLVPSRGKSVWDRWTAGSQGPECPGEPPQAQAPPGPRLRPDPAPLPPPRLRRPATRREGRSHRRDLLPHERAAGGTAKVRLFTGARRARPQGSRGHQGHGPGR